MNRDLDLRSHGRQPDRQHPNTVPATTAGPPPPTAGGYAMPDPKHQRHFATATRWRSSQETATTWLTTRGSATCLTPLLLSHMNTTFLRRSARRLLAGLSADDLAGLRIAQQAILSVSLRSPGPQAFGHWADWCTQAGVVNTLRGSREIPSSKSNLLWTVPSFLTNEKRATNLESLAPFLVSSVPLARRSPRWLENPLTEPAPTSGTPRSRHAPWLCRGDPPPGPTPAT
jgi:hypothetical protein